MSHVDDVAREVISRFAATCEIVVELAPSGERCADCPEVVHRAWFAVESRPLCIRHTGDVMFPEDDMAAHDVVHALYQELNGLSATALY